MDSIVYWKAAANEMGGREFIQKMTDEIWVSLLRTRTESSARTRIGISIEPFWPEKDKQ